MGGSLGLLFPPHSRSLTKSDMHSTTCSYPNVIYDPTEPLGKFRLWYDGFVGGSDFNTSQVMNAPLLQEHDRHRPPTQTKKAFPGDQLSVVFTFLGCARIYLVNFRSGKPLAAYNGSQNRKWHRVLHSLLPSFLLVLFSPEGHRPRGSMALRQL